MNARSSLRQSALRESLFSGTNPQKKPQKHEKDDWIYDPNSLVSFLLLPQRGSQGLPLAIPRRCPSPLVVPHGVSLTALMPRHTEAPPGEISMKGTACQTGNLCKDGDNHGRQDPPVTKETCFRLSPWLPASPKLSRALFKGMRSLCRRFPS